MSGRKFLIIFAGICLLLVSIVILNPFTQQNSLIDKENNNNSESDNSNSFLINNWDNTSHEVTVELLNSKNASVFNKSYTTVHGETIKGQFPVTLESGTEIKVILDNSITKTQIVSEDSTGLVLYIDIYMVTSDPLFLSIALP
jgi:hypothetical protein